MNDMLGLPAYRVCDLKRAGEEETILASAPDSMTKIVVRVNPASLVGIRL
jgi:hypothetical protein